MPRHRLSIDIYLFINHYHYLTLTTPVFMRRYCIMESKNSKNFGIGRKNMLSLNTICVFTGLSSIDLSSHMVVPGRLLRRCQQCLSSIFLCYLTCVSSLSVLVDTAAPHIHGKGNKEKVLHNMEPLKTAFIFRQFSNPLRQILVDLPDSVCNRKC